MKSSRKPLELFSLDGSNRKIAHSAQQSLTKYHQLPRGYGTSRVHKKQRYEENGSRINLREEQKSFPLSGGGKKEAFSVHRWEKWLSCF